jgi:hypothetical protein
MADPKGEEGPLTKFSNFFEKMTEDAKSAIEKVKDAVTGAPETGPSGAGTGGSKRRRRLLKKSAKKSAKKKAKKNKKKGKSKKKSRRM